MAENVPPTVDHFKCDVRRFDTIDNEIKQINDKMKPLQTRLKELKNTRKELETDICKFMETNEIGECKLADGALHMKESKKVIPLTKENIRENIMKFFNEQYTDEFKKMSDKDKAETLFKFVYENREYKQNSTLKRV